MLENREIGLILNVGKGKLPVGINQERKNKTSRIIWAKNTHNHCLKTLIMLRISQISKEVNKKSKTNSEDTTKKVLTAFLEIAKEKLIQGESINFKGYFTIKRNTTPAKGSKNCDEHQKELDKFKQANQGKGVQFYAKSSTFRNLVTKTRNCSKCKAKKQQLIKSAKPTNRISFKVSKNF